MLWIFGKLIVCSHEALKTSEKCLRSSFLTRTQRFNRLLRHKNCENNEQICGTRRSTGARKNFFHANLHLDGEFGSWWTSEEKWAVFGKSNFYCGSKCGRISIAGAFKMWDVILVLIKVFGTVPHTIQNKSDRFLQFFKKTYSCN